MSGDIMTESHVPGAEGEEAVCPVCDSHNTEQITDGTSATSVSNAVPNSIPAAHE